METGVVHSVNGPVEAKYGNKYGICIDGQWYDFFTKYPFPNGVVAGATVEFIAAPSTGTYNPKITKIKATGAGASVPRATFSNPTPGLREAAVPTPVGRGGDREVAIMRQNAVTNANKFFENNMNNSGSLMPGYSIKDLLEVAEILTSYYKGELDPTTFGEDESLNTLETVVSKIRKTKAEANPEQSEEAA